MSLGVLNNLSAMYAANNLNNTNNSLSKTLQQLSSGSRINSGADDAAGLSLVDGLQANATALSQSQVNAQEGVGLLQVADGALSQVTNLLNRAVTLATEASNGTLNGAQTAAANQEFQSILGEINNIGATTTYNGQAVFGNTLQHLHGRLDEHQRDDRCPQLQRHRYHGGSRRSKRRRCLHSRHRLCLHPSRRAKAEHRRSDNGRRRQLLPTSMPPSTTLQCRMAMSDRRSIR